MGRAFAREKGLGEYEVEFARGAQAAQDPLAFESLPLLSDEDKEVLRRETTHRWSHPAAVRLRLPRLLAFSLSSEAVLTSLSPSPALLPRHLLLDGCCDAGHGAWQSLLNRAGALPDFSHLSRRTSRSSTAPTCSSDPSSASTLLAATRMLEGTSGFSVS